MEGEGRAEISDNIIVESFKRSFCHFFFHSDKLYFAEFKNEIALLL